MDAQLPTYGVGDESSWNMYGHIDTLLLIIFMVQSQFQFNTLEMLVK
jgi:hypothetical protein